PVPWNRMTPGSAQTPANAGAHQVTEPQSRRVAGSAPATQPGDARAHPHDESSSRATESSALDSGSPDAGRTTIHESLRVTDAGLGEQRFAQARKPNGESSLARSMVDRSKASADSQRQESAPRALDGKTQTEPAEAGSTRAESAPSR